MEEELTGEEKGALETNLWKIGGTAFIVRLQTILSGQMRARKKERMEQWKLLLEHGVPNCKGKTLNKIVIIGWYYVGSVQITSSVTSKISPNVCKSCPKKISLKN